MTKQIEAVKLSDDAFAVVLMAGDAYNMTHRLLSPDMSDEMLADVNKIKLDFARLMDNLIKFHDKSMVCAEVSIEQDDV